MSWQVRIRPACAGDLEVILALERAAETAPHWPRSAYAATVEPAQPGRPQRCLFVAESEDGSIAGFAGGVLHEMGATAELESVAVSPVFRRAGIGRLLCIAVLDWSRQRGATAIALEVRAASTAAIALYTSLGFTAVGRRPRYYRDPEDDALLLRLALSGEGSAHVAHPSPCR